MGRNFFKFLKLDEFNLEIFKYPYPLYMRRSDLDDSVYFESAPEWRIN